MTCSTLTTTIQRLTALAVIGLALLLQGCGCPNPGFSCSTVMPEAGTYRVRYLQTSGLEDTIETPTTTGGAFYVCNCSEIIEATLISKNSPPDCSQASATVHTLWPPNQDLVDIPVEGVTDPDGDTFSIRVDARVDGDEEGFGLFPEDLYPDFHITGTSTAEVRAERDPNGNGRVYRIGFLASDGPGATCRGEERVCVPQFFGGTCVDDSRRADLSINGFDAPDPVNQGEVLTYTINISNGSAYGTASNVTLTDTLPTGVIFISAEIDGNPQRCAELLGLVTCDLGDLGIDHSKTAAISIRPTTVVGMIINTASVRALEKDPSPSNNTLTQTTTVNPSASGADASVSIAVVPNPVTVNNELKFTIVVQNLNPQTAATGVTMTGFNLQLVGEQLGVETSQGSCSQSRGALTCNIGTLAGGASATVTIRAIPFNVGNYTETVTVTSTNDPNSANNSASVQVQVKPP